MSPRPRATEIGPRPRLRRGRPRRQLAAGAALVLLCVTSIPLLALAADVADVLTVLGCVFAATYYLWFFAVRRGAARYLGLLATGLAVAGMVSFAHEHRPALAVWLVMVVVFGVTAWAAVRSTTAPSSDDDGRLTLPAPRPR